jgi:hypothetical protein
MRGRGGALGDDAMPQGPVAVLAAQVNRFGPGAPVAYQFAPVAFPVVNVLDPALALAALTIYLRRSTDAYQQVHDAGTLAAIDAANAGYADPSAFVLANLPQVTSVITMFADSLGLPGTTSAAGSLSTSSLLLAAGILGIWWWTEKR